MPEDANDLALYLVHAEGELLSCQTLTQLYRSFGESGAQEEFDQSNWQLELQKGENERREFKPFIAPTDVKELEIVKTAVAFANTDGGTIFVGVDNEGVPIGVAQARKCFKSEEPIDAQMARLKVLIRESTQPVPSIACKIASVSGQPIIVVEINKSETICSTHDNRAYVRRGATNRLADPRTELPSLSKTSNSDVWDNSLHSYAP
ncbi:MAG: ATP-binding protein [Acidobacteria bacterium]|nr:ATP-binding protein [Acidobacteriota bacterium]